jgi:hypothetical protein
LTDAFCCPDKVIHAIDPALLFVQIFDQITSAFAQALDYLFVKAGIVQTADSFDILGSAARVTHICYYSFDIYPFHICILIDCLDIR